jgi:hypothetical protein
VPDEHTCPCRKPHAGHTCPDEEVP